MNRKVLKKDAKRVFKLHYGFLLAVCMISGLFATEFNDAFSWLSSSDEVVVEQTSNSLPSNLGASQVLQDVLTDHLQEGEDAAKKLEKEQVDTSKNPMFGRTRGVLATVINSISSGSIYVSIVAGINSIIGSEDLSIIIMIVAGLVLFFVLWFFIQNTYKVISRRIFLEARTYKKVPFDRFLFLIHIKCWAKASFTMFLTYVFHSLWSLTIIGGIIKHYSYFLVPYIVAENPSIKARDAIQLSRSMMYGHKWECFKFEISFFGWYVLSSLTMGLSGLLFSNPYKVATFAEYYVLLRQKAKEDNLPLSDLMNDEYLYVQATPEILKKAYPEIKNESLEVSPLPRLQQFFASLFGILFKEGEREKRYETQRSLVQEYQEIKRAVHGEEYPTRLFTIPEEDKNKLFSKLDPLRNYSIWSLILMFFIFSMIGWFWEVSLHLITDGVFVNRGALHGPWLPIYGSGGLLILTLLKKFRQKPVLTFVLILIVCGVLEYSTSYIMEMNTGLKWWDYSGYFLNLDGRICAEGLMVFGAGGMAFIYVLAPTFDNLIKKVKPYLVRIICIVLLIILSFDAIYSHFSPNTGAGITDYDDK